MALSDVHVWLGTFESQERWNEYFEEHYSEDEDDALSEFAENQADHWYDHDFLIAMRFDSQPNESPTVQARSLIEKLPYSASFIDQALATLPKQLLAAPDSVISITVEQIRSPVSVKVPGVELTFIGTFERRPPPPQFDPDATELSLTDHRLTSVPDEVFDLGNLTELSLARNELVELPDQFHRLQRLETLYLYGNQLTELPPSLFTLPNLKKIKADNNQISALPETMSCVALETLLLGRNKLQSLPHDIGNLVNLQLLDVTQNELAEIPASIGQLRQLERLRFYGNAPLQELPDEICDLKSLRFFMPFRTGLKALPDGMSKLASVTALHVQLTQVAVLPPDVGSMPALQELRVGALMTTLPPEIGQLESLTELTLSESNIRHLPDEISRLNLTQLHLPRGFPIDEQSPVVQAWLAPLLS